MVEFVVHAPVPAAVAHGYDPFLLKYCSKASLIVLRSDLRDVSRPLTCALENEVTPIPVNTPIMAMTTSSSMRVNPADVACFLRKYCLRSLFFIVSISLILLGLLKKIMVVFECKKQCRRGTFGMVWSTNPDC